MSELDTPVEPEDQRRAAELAQAMVEQNEAAVGALLVELVDAGLERTLAVTAVLARNLAAALVTLVGAEGAQRMLESTRLDAAVASDD
ncbi:hypothetical protein A5731_04690 [Mycolicibacterium conceptionense]|uniref:Uncharacterized protein n=1 Tax=Mycolicibacterium conceptionense TaxID=451644 RepID=A0A1A1WP47_9MYCO|nr:MULTISPECIES: hypothetical protein [Mycolicibacterium]MCW1821428.1 hypothetical protein [Mycolicibacterium senegalense]OBB07557.1 hypothetical protein A5718_17080 [Mycolicibacterium conceptionense]OBF08579.1 hypothetical protein A5731_04690 [Mycolicibacterium conceptionense]OBF23895.1 hypothetical protein A5726_10460 [Mycolicibacterium conceptionense]OBF32053.1 hypothetical protein A5720_27615 [Mycolicibacterium conceptionense]